MPRRKPLSAKAWILVITAALLLALGTGVVAGAAAPDVTWLHYLLPAVLAVVAVLVFKALGGFQQLDAARRKKKGDRP
jgi:membrane protein YdbS with pleckstrin-like domain